MALRQISLDGDLLRGGIQRAAALTGEPILSIAHGRTLTFVVLKGGGLVLSWRLPLPEAVDGSFVFGIPPMISSHLATHLASGAGPVRLALHGAEVTLVTKDVAGSYELRWHFDLNSFPAPPDLSRLLVPPATLLSMDYLRVADAIHRAVARLVRIEREGQIHRTNLAILLALSNGDLLIEAHEVALWEQDCYYFDPRLVMRALECIQGPRVWVGLTALGPRRGFFSLVDRRPDRLTHCALLSIDQDTQRLVSSSTR
ncbi:MAG: hypothetical protein P8129_00950 [Anaerolineae bacterium]